MAKNPLFSTYRQGENRLTSSRLAVFERMDLSLLEAILPAAAGEFRQTAPRSRTRAAPRQAAARTHPGPQTARPAGDSQWYAHRSPSINHVVPAKRVSARIVRANHPGELPALATARPLHSEGAPPRPLHLREPVPSEDHLVVPATLQTLPVRQRAIVVLRYLQDLFAPARRLSASAWGRSRVGRHVAWPDYVPSSRTQPGHHERPQDIEVGSPTRYSGRHRLDTGPGSSHGVSASRR